MKAADIIYSALVGTPAVTAIAGTRAYPIEVPADVELPAIWIVVALGDSVDGSLPEQEAQIQIGCLAHTETEAHDLADAVDAKLNGLTRYSGGTWLRGMYRTSRTPARDAENNIWGIILGYGAGVTY